MLSCKDITRLASDYEDLNLGFRDRMQMRLHIFICVHCRNFMKQFRLSRKVVRHQCEHHDASMTEEMDRQTARLIDISRKIRNDEK